jgi:hypothetical protein
MTIRQLIKQKSKGCVVAHLSNVMDARVKFKALLEERMATYA